MSFHVISELKDMTVLDLVEKVKIGIIGCGVAAHDFILPNLVQPQIAKKGVRLVAVCDPIKSRAEENMRTFRAKEMYTDYREMLAKADINAVFILTPVNLHYPLAIEAAHAGKHIYLQKAMTTTLEEANNLLSTVKKEGVKLVASPGQMHNPSLRMAKEMVDNGLIGRPLWGCIFANKEGHTGERTDPSWYYRPGGGPVYTYLVYSVTSFCWMLGSVKRVASFSGIAIPTRWWRNKKIDSEMDDSTMILMDFGDSTFVSAISNFCVKGVMDDSIIYGTKGIIHIPLSVQQSTQHTPTQVLLFNLRKEAMKLVRGLTSKTSESVEWTPPLFKFPYSLAAPWGANIILDILEFVDCIIKDREPTVATGERARHVIEVFEKAYISARTGKTQQLQTTFS